MQLLGNGHFNLSNHVSKGVLTNTEAQFSAQQNITLLVSV